MRHCCSPSLDWYCVQQHFTAIPAAGLLGCVSIRIVHQWAKPAVFKTRPQGHNVLQLLGVSLVKHTWIKCLSYLLHMQPWPPESCSWSHYLTALCWSGGTSKCFGRFTSRHGVLKTSGLKGFLILCKIAHLKLVCENRAFKFRQRRDLTNSWKVKGAQILLEGPVDGFSFTQEINN